MSKLGDHLVAELTGGRGLGEVAGTFAGQLRQLVTVAGSQRRAAQIAGIDRRTLQRRLADERAGRPVRPKAGTVAKVGTGLRRAQLAPSRPADAGFSITVHDRADTHKHAARSRTLGAGQLKLAPGTLERAADAWVRTGDGNAVADAFLRGVGDKFYRRWLTPARSDRAPTSSTGGGFADEGDQDVPRDAGEADELEEDEDEGYELTDIPEDAWAEFFEDVYDDSALPDDDDYGADP